MKRLASISCSLVLLLGLAGFAFSQSAQQPSDQGAKNDVKEAGRSTGRAAKKTGHRVKRGTQKVTHKAARKTRQGAEKVEDKTQPQ